MTPHRRKSLNEVAMIRRCADAARRITASGLLTLTYRDVIAVGRAYCPRAVGKRRAMRNARWEEGS